MKKCCSLVLCAVLLLSLCGCGGPKKYTADTFAFDTVISLVAYCDSEEQFQQLRSVVFGRIQELHKKFDIYNEYEGMNNLCTVNRLSGQPVEVDQDIADLLVSARGIWSRTDGLVNIAQGKLFALWKTARDTGVLPTDEAIRDGIDFYSLEDFSLVICKPDRRIIYSHCQWSGISEEAGLGAMVLEKVTVVASKRIETGV